MRLDLYPLVRLTEGYIIMADDNNLAKLQQSGLNYELLSNSVSISQLAIDHNREFKHPELFQIIYQQDYFRLLLGDQQAAKTLPIIERPIFNFAGDIKIEYNLPLIRGGMPDKASAELEQALDMISVDSLQSYVYRMQAYFRRPFMSDSLRACTRWLHQKFEDFGYDSILYDTFSTPLLQAFDSSVNVVAVKPGLVLPDYQIVIGAHYDGVEPSPAADDNASGAAAVMEMARVFERYTH